VFWTVPVPSDSVQVTPDSSTITWRLANFPVSDSHDVVNALRVPEVGPSVPAVVSFVMQWGEVTGVTELRDANEQFAARVIERKVTMQWEANQDGFKFVSDPANTSQTVYAGLATERNGVFFS
jgi:hypothetical protein